MKRNKIYGIIFVLLLIFFYNSNSDALDFIIGARVWYFYWDPLLKEMEDEFDIQQGWKDIETEDGSMYGPGFGFVINDKFSFNLSYLYGEFDSEYNSQFITNNRQVKYIGNVRTIRHDIDGAVGYAITNNFKTFVNLRYQPSTITIQRRGADWELDNSGNLSGQGGHLKNELKFKYRFFAPGIGFGYAYLLNDLIALSINVSALYFDGTLDVSSETRYNSVDSWQTEDVVKDPEVNIKLNGKGFSVEPAVIIFAKKNILFQVGARYQQVWMDGKTNDLTGPSEFKGLVGRLIGCNLTFLYEF